MTSEHREISIALIASQGGHLQQMLRLRSIYVEHDHFLVTTKPDPDRIVNDRIDRQYFVVDINEGRGIRNPFKLFWSIVQVAWVFAKERPSILISTGAGVAVPAFLIGYVFRIPSVFIESYARIHDLGKSGKVCYRLASRFFVQHPELQARYPSSLYRGSVYEHI